MDWTLVGVGVVILLLVSGVGFKIAKAIWGSEHRTPKA